MLQFILTGRLAADPEITTYGADAKPMARLRVASSQPGSERADFFDVAVFDDHAIEVLADARKGDKVDLKGNARQGTWTTTNGERREGVSLTARTVAHRPRRPPAAGPTAENVHSASAAVAR